MPVRPSVDQALVSEALSRAKATVHLLAAARSQQAATSLPGLAVTSAPSADFLAQLRASQLAAQRTAEALLKNQEKEH